MQTPTAPVMSRKEGNRHCDKVRGVIIETKARTHKIPVAGDPRVLLVPWPSEDEEGEGFALQFTNGLLDLVLDEREDLRQLQAIREQKEEELTRIEALNKKLADKQAKKNLQDKRLLDSGLSWKDRTARPFFFTFVGFCFGVFTLIVAF